MTLMAEVLRIFWLLAWVALLVAVIVPKWRKAPVILSICGVGTALLVLTAFTGIIGYNQQQEQLHQQHLAWQRSHPQEYAAMLARQRAAQLVHQRRAAALAHESQPSVIAAGEKADLDTLFTTLNSSTSGRVVVRWESQSDTALLVTLDGNVYQYLSTQDQNMLKQTIEGAWNVSYNNRHHTHREVTVVEFQDEAGDSL